MKFKVIEVAGKFAIQDTVGNCFGSYKTRVEAQRRCEDWIAYYAEPLPKGSRI